MIRLARSSAFRIALAFAGGLIATTYVVFAVVDWRFYRSNVALVQSILQDEITSASNEPTTVLRRRLELRLTQDLRHLDYVGLYDKSGALSFGNINDPAVVPVDGRPHLIRMAPPQPEPWQSENTILVAQRRADGSTLILGRSLVYVDQLGQTMLRVFVGTIGPVVLLALAIGILVSVRASRRLGSIRQAIAQVMAGDLHVRLPSRPSPNDVDELCRAVNRMLDEIGRLIGQIRSVGDNIAHDLRAPLAVMRARLERGLSGTSDAVMRELASEALRDLERAMTTVTALLRISDLESGLRRGAFSAVDLPAVCRDAFELYQPLAEAKGIDMTFEAFKPLVCSGDGDLLREALANLIDNAVKFTPSGGRVLVTCGEADTLVRVCDSGPGIPPSERGEVVKRFYRSAATRHLDGVGLGLSMAATIMDLHGFDLEIDDAGPGARFTVRQKPANTSMQVGEVRSTGGQAVIRRLAAAWRKSGVSGASARRT